MLGSLLGVPLLALHTNTLVPLLDCTTARLVVQLQPTPGQLGPA
jgi:hypothetical protein